MTTSIKKLWSALGIAAALAFSAQAEAQQEVKFGQPRFIGSGCDQNSASFSPSPDGRSFTVLFDEMTLETSALSSSRMCSIYVDVTVPAGKKLSLKRFDLRSFMNLPKRSAGGVGVYPQFFQSGKTKNLGWLADWKFGAFNDGLTSTFEIKKDFSSFCGGKKQTLILHNFVGVYDWNRPNKEKLVTFDSVDGTSLPLEGQMALESCS